MSDRGWLRSSTRSQRSARLSKVSSSVATRSSRSTFEALKSKQAELETQGQTADALAEKLCGLIGNEAEDLTANENLATLRALLVEKCGLPEGFASASELEAAKKDAEEIGARLEEAKKTQDSLELDLAKAKEQYHQLGEEKDKAVSDLNATLQAKDDAVQAGRIQSKRIVRPD
ncbi:hypothetical protein DL89DRAFT_144367 [Linderina pennispora]|uniref:Uncharacterized protein n=1 Tax=Linderina pennispora TaxID=61395 RepID=A0A1Y1WC25_9FUNG|nr:uncharacterized protein DL89DRAFT_144367 [Linderina pennispora]ORX70982.1 hypothetical protein DL89DRAFT_144367 [Linderina pennispora]